MPHHDPRSLRFPAISSAQTLLAGIPFNGIAHDKMTAAQVAHANSLATMLRKYNNTANRP